MNDKKDIVLSISVMTSGERTELWKCLDSLGGLRESVPSELIITDTGCDESTRKKLAGYADKIVKFEWCDDFSAARNAGLDAASGKWYLYLDDDEWFEDTSELERFFCSGEYKNTGSVLYVQRNYKDLSGTVFEDAWVLRCFRIEDGICFIGRIHEYVDVDGVQKNVHDFVHHFGYAYKGEGSERERNVRNTRLLERMVEEEPDSLRWRIHLAQEYYISKDYDALYRLGEDSLIRYEGSDDPGTNHMLGTFYASEILACVSRGDKEGAYASALTALSDKRNSRMTFAYASYFAGQSRFEKRDYPMVAEYFKKYFENLIWLEENENDRIVQGSTNFVCNYAERRRLFNACCYSVCAGLETRDIYLTKTALGYMDTGDRRRYFPEGVACVLGKHLMEDVNDPADKISDGNAELKADSEDELFCVLRELKGKISKNDRLISAVEKGQRDLMKVRDMKRSGKILLSISVLVSGRGDEMWKCLDSMKRIREELPCELIVTDTGCDENTAARLKEYADQYLSFTWCDDFSAARNAGLDNAKGEWFMFIDDDEWFEDTACIERFFREGEYKNFKSAAYKIRNYKDFDGKGFIDSWITRLFYLGDGARFKGRVHEMIEPFAGPTAQINDYVHHYGYLYKTPEEEKKHYERNRVLLEKMISDEPKILRWRVHLLQEYMSHADYDLLIKEGEASLELLEDKNSLNDEERLALGTFYAACYLGCYAQGWHEGALASAKRGLADKRITEMATAHLALGAARESILFADPEMAGEYLDIYTEKSRWLKANPTQRFFQSNSAFTRNYDTANSVFEAECIAFCVRLESGEKMDDDITKMLNSERIPFLPLYLPATIVRYIRSNRESELSDRILENVYSDVRILAAYIDALGEASDLGLTAEAVLEFAKYSPDENVPLLLQGIIKALDSGVGLSELAPAIKQTVALWPDIAEPMKILMSALG